MHSRHWLHIRQYTTRELRLLTSHHLEDLNRRQKDLARLNEAMDLDIRPPRIPHILNHAAVAATGRVKGALPSSTQAVIPWYSPDLCKPRLPTKRITLQSMRYTATTATTRLILSAIALWVTVEGFECSGLDTW